MLTQPRVNFTSVLWAAFAPVDLCRTSGVPHKVYSIKVGHNFKLYELVELSAVLLVKLNSIFLCLTLCASAFVLCASGLVKLTQPRAFLFGYSPTPHTHELNKTDQKFGMSYENVYNKYTKRKNNT